MLSWHKSNTFSVESVTYNKEARIAVDLKRKVGIEKVYKQKTTS